MAAKKIGRVRCVLARDGRYLLVLHNNRLPENYGKWGLPGGVLDKGEEPSTGLRRELYEEFQLAVDNIVMLGDWEYRNEVHRVFGCAIDNWIKFFDRDEILAVEWLTYDGVVGLVEDGKLHTGFELEAIERFRNQVAK